MFNKLHDLYPNSLLKDQMPNNLPGYYWFHEKEKDQWLGIPANEMTNEELELLKRLFDYHEPSFIYGPSAQSWYDFLFFNGSIPQTIKEKKYRVIQFSASNGDWDTEDLESAFRGLFAEDIIVLWNDRTRGMIIEEYSIDSPAEEELQFLSTALESDFYIKTFFYLGVPDYLTSGFADCFKEEKSFFEKSLPLIPSERVFTFEKIFPSLIVDGLTEDLRDGLSSRLLLLKEDPELLMTIKVFLQNNSNVSLTAKKLYIHRNTLQYRLDKFTEKTGMNLKDFNSAATVYLACLLYDQRN